MSKNKKEVVALVDAAGPLQFNSWYKNSLTYVNAEFTVVIVPEYRSTLTQQETLDNLLQCEDYPYVNVYKGLEKPWQWEWYKAGDDS